MLHLCSISGQREVVDKLEMDLKLRRVYVLTTVGSQPIVVTFLLYAVLSVDPPLADVGGGTELTITSEGVPPESAGRTLCQFASGSTTDATWLSANQVRCKTPEANATSEDCAGEVGLRHFADHWDKGQGSGIRPAVPETTLPGQQNTQRS